MAEEGIGDQWAPEHSLLSGGGALEGAAEGEIGVQGALEHVEACRYPRMRQSVSNDL